MTTDRYRTGAAVGAFTAALLTAAAYLLSALTMPGSLEGQEGWATWMHLPGALFSLVLVAVPTVGGVLLLDDRSNRRLFGAALVAGQGLLAALILPSFLWSGLPADLPFRAQAILSVLAVVAAAGAGVLGALVLAHNSHVSFADPRHFNERGARLAALGALVVAAVVQVAPRTAVPDAPPPPWFHGIFSGGTQSDALLQGGLSVVLPAAGLVAVALVVAAIRPALAAVGVGVSVAALEVVNIINQPLINQMSETMWDQPTHLTGWYWVHVAATFVLVAALVAIQREDSHQEKPAVREQMRP